KTNARRRELLLRQELGRPARAGGEVEAARQEFERLNETAAKAQEQGRLLAQQSSPEAKLSKPQVLPIREETARQIADLEMRRRLDSITPGARPQAEAEIQAELAARERNLNAMEAEALKRAMVGNVIADQKRQYSDLTREIELQSRTALEVAASYGQGLSAVMRAEAQRSAQLENLRNGIDATARSEELLKAKVAETAEAQARAALQAQESADAARRIAGAEAGGSAAVNATGDSEASLRRSIEATTKAIEAQSSAERAGQLIREKRLATNDLVIANLEREAAATSNAAERRAKELAIERERRLLAQKDKFGGVDPALTEAQDAAASLREQARYFNEVRDQAKSISSDIANFLVDGFVNAGKAGKSVFANLADGAVGLFRRMAAKIAATLIEQKFILPITTQIVGAFPSLFGVVGPQAVGQAAGGATAAASAGGGIFESIGKWFSGLFGAGHDGALIGIAPSHSRMVAISSFTGAERFHAGGMLGLRPDEVPFVGLRGEEVLTRNDPRHRWNMDRLSQMRPPNPANDVQVSIYDMRIGRDQPPARTEQRRGSDGKKEIAVFIEDKIDEAIRSGRLDRAQA
ncbi:MAG: hypothetical protein EBY21_14590, partial [Alphaproteobacteria bacterium]|nr:hypothetical protein [Alphaproteobacteria bacterium]